MKQETPPPKQISRDRDEPIMHPGPNDVLMGRGAPSTDYLGNLHFRELVKERRDDYVNAKRRKDKQIVAGEIIATVQRRGGRFLERVETCRKTKRTGKTEKVTIWRAVEDRKTLLVKVKQLMRDVGPEAQQKRSIRREYRRQKETESVVKTPTRSETETGPSSTSVAAPPLQVGLPVGYATQSAQLPPASLPGSLGNPSLRTALDTEERLTRLHLERQLALYEDALLQQQMQLRQPNQQLLLSGANAFNFPVHPHGQNVFRRQYGDALHRQPEEALLQHQLQRLQMMPHSHTGLSLPHIPLLSQRYLVPSRHLEGTQPNSLLAAILLRNAETLPYDDSSKPSTSEDKNKRWWQTICLLKFLRFVPNYCLIHSQTDTMMIMRAPEALSNGNSNSALDPNFCRWSDNDLEQNKMIMIMRSMNGCFLWLNQISILFRVGKISKVVLWRVYLLSDPTWLDRLGWRFARQKII